MIELPVPYFRQPEEYACYPTVLAMVRRFYGLADTPESVIGRLPEYDPQKGTAHEDVLAFLQREGTPGVRTTTRRVGDIIRLLEHGIPAIATIPNFDDDHSHVLVVRGHYRDVLLVNDPYAPHRRIVGKRAFEERWRREEHELLYIPR